MIYIYYVLVIIGFTTLLDMSVPKKSYGFDDHLSNL